MAAKPADIAELYRTHGSAVFRRIRRFYAEDEAEEVLQEVFVRLLSTPSDFRGDAAVTTWLYQVTTRHCLNRLRDARRRRELLLEHGYPAWTEPVRAANQEPAVFLRELWRELDEELALIGVYYFVDGLPHVEIARIMGVSKRTIGARVERLRAIANKVAGGTP